MALTNRKPLPTIGVDKYTFFPLTEDTAEGATYGEAYSLKGTVEISPTDSGGSDVFDADNGAYETSSYIEKLGHEITNADIPPEVDAMWRGLERKNGLVTVGNDTKTVYFAVAWRILKSDGTYRYVRYLKGSYSFASNVGGKTKPSSGSIERQTAKATYTAIQRDFDNMYYEYIDETELPEGLTKEEFEENWFTDMNYYPAGKLGTLSVNSSAGTSGNTVITVTPSPQEGNKLVYKTDESTAPTVSYDEVLSDWTEFTSGDEITATTGHKITVAEVTAENKAVKSGSADIVSGE